MSNIWKYGIVSIAITLCSATLKAQELTVNINSNLGKPLANIVVYLEPEDKSLVEKYSMPEKQKASVDQVNRQFSPHISVVQKSTHVSFPNSDNIKHHVYSFSAAKSFEIQLYDDKQSAPIMFDKAGEVTLGCNIHDWMLGYVYVVDTPWFGKTNEEGQLNVDLPEGRYQLKVWHPLLGDADLGFSKKIVVTKASNETITLKEKMIEAHSAYEEDDELDGY